MCVCMYVCMQVIQTWDSEEEDDMLIGKSRERTRNLLSTHFAE